jgi:hypothetical protein
MGHIPKKMGVPLHWNLSENLWTVPLLEDEFEEQAYCVVSKSF